MAKKVSKNKWIGVSKKINNSLDGSYVELSILSNWGNHGHHHATILFLFHMIRFSLLLYHLPQR